MSSLAINYKLLTINYKLSTINYKLIHDVNRGE